MLGLDEERWKNAEPADKRNNLGIPDRDQNRMQEARQEYEESLKIYRTLAQKNPEAYLPNVAATLNNLGVLDRDKNRMEEALETYRRLTEKDPATYLPYVTTVSLTSPLADCMMNTHRGTDPRT